MRFYQVPRSGGPPPNAEFPCVVLAVDAWNDYGYYTLRRLRYFTSRTDPILFEGDVKILQRDSYITQLPDEFETLGDEFCSLGQSFDYYRQISKLPAPVYQEILASLRDIVFSPNLATEFRMDRGFSTSLLRFSDAANALKHAGSLFGLRTLPRRADSKRFFFTFDTLVPGAEQPHTFSLDFSPNVTGLNRIAALIGRNGTGKTQVLARFANAMSGLKYDGQFQPFRPEFSRVIAISYSVFDDFDRPQADKSFSYTYCGIRPLDAAIFDAVDPGSSELPAPDTLLSAQAIRLKLQQAIDRAHLLKREVVWTDTMAILFGGQVDLPSLVHDGRLHELGYAQLSSGQRILILVISELIAAIEEESIVLYDEPELYLHPDAQTGLARALHNLLEAFNSYAIIATHSPIFLQEVPSRMVRVFHREGKIPFVDKLPLESFGESLSTITDRVFEVTPSQQNYRKYLAQLAAELSEEDLINSFGTPGLGMHARAFIRSAVRSASDSDTDGDAE